IAEELDLVNSRRQEIEREIVQEAQEMIQAEGGLKERRAIVLGRKGWHPGVIGIVASRLVDYYQRPTVIVAFGDEFAQGSARSVTGFNLYEAIRDCSEGLIGFGGHAAAAGLKVTESEKLEPHGLGNPRPLLLASQVRIMGELRLVGEFKNHLQVRMVQGNSQIKAIGWNMAEKAKELTANTSCTIVFHPSINEWNGRRDVQLELKDLVVENDQAASLAAPLSS